MIFIDDTLHIVKIFDNIPPCEEDPCPTYRCEKRAKYVLEINGGISEKDGFEMGDSVVFQNF